MSFGDFTNTQQFDFMLQSSMGQFEGYAPEFVIGINPSAGIGALETIWDQGGIRLTPPVASDFFVSSSSGADTGGIAVLVTGLDDDYNRFFELVALNGQSQVQLTNTGNWIQTVLVTGSPASGDVYLYTTSTTTAGVPDDATAIQGKVIFGNCITRIAAYMVPEGKAAVTVAIRGGTDDTSKIANVKTRITPFPGAPPLITVEYSVTPSFPGFIFPMPVAAGVSLFGNQALLPGRSTIEFLATSNSNNTQVFFGTDILLVDLDRFRLG